jgi:hypothetical protein
VVLPALSCSHSSVTAAATAAVLLCEQTFEVLAMPGLTKQSLTGPLEALPTDTELESPAVLQALRRGTYSLLSQLRP